MARETVVLLLLSVVACIFAYEYDCTFRSSSGDFYDLSALSKCDQSGYTITSSDGTFVLNVCNNVVGCGSSASVCQDNNYDCGHASSATFSNYAGPGKGVVLTYANGANSCPGSVSRKSVITFVCDQNAVQPVLSFVNENPTCTYNFNVRSKEACPRTPAPQQQLCYTNVFLVPHTHDDVGWLMTVEGYYETQVKHILDTSVQALVDNPNRKFIYVEQSYFTRWWYDPNTSDQQRANLRRLVNNGQWEFVLGGWVMPDEAATTYGGVTDQMTLGHQFLLSTFGVTPTKGWQIDPFGASSITPVLYKLAGCDGHIIDRITNKGMYESSQRLDFLWQGSPTLGKKAELFTEIMGGGGYCDYLGAFDFNNDPVNPGNVATWGQKMVNMVSGRAGWYKTPNILAEWGCDFAFQNAAPMFHSMDQVVTWLQQNANKTRVNVKYATLSEYFSAVQESARADQITWPTDVGGDYFPYLASLWWTGYYTSRVQLKGFVRRGEATSHLSEPLFALGRLLVKVDNKKAYDQLYTLRVANGNAQHHDGVTGTSVPEVVEMYKDDLINGMNNALSASSTLLNQLVCTDNNVPTPNLVGNTDGLLSIGNGQTYVLVVTNPLGWTRNEVITVAVNRNDLSVVNANGTKVVSQTIVERGGNQTGKYYLSFYASNVPPLGYDTYFVVAPPSQSYYYETTKSKVMAPGADVVLENSLISVTVDGTTGRVSRITNKKSGVSVPVDQDLFEYTSLHSGAYAFGPAGPAVPVSQSVPTTTVTNGNLFSEVYQVFSTPGGSYAKQTVRVYKSPNGPDPDVEDFVEFSFDLGPLPSHREIVTRFSTGIANGNTFSTDANGFQFLDREYNWNQGIESNYYPMVYAAYIKDSLAQLSVIGERSHGASSVANGQLEVMVHRNPDMGDNFGPGLTDTTEVYPQLRVLLNRPSSSLASVHRQTYLMNFPTALFTAPTQSPGSWKSQYFTTGRFLSGDLPPNIHLQGLLAIDATTNKAILRFAHIFANGEDAMYSQPVTIDVAKYFSETFTIKSISETTLTANKVINPNPGTSIQISPSEIRTFLVEFALPNGK